MKSRPSSRTVRIAGAGPAGLCAAVALAKAGYDTIVHERHEDVGMRFSEDFQALENWTSPEDILETIRRLGFDTDFYCRPIEDMYAFGPRSAAHVRFPRPFAYLIRRGREHGSLDASLKRTAQDCGVRLHFNSRLSESGADIVATGPRQAKAVAAGILFETDLASCSGVLLDESVAPRGYAYLLIAEGRGTLATVRYHPSGPGKGSLDAAIDRFTYELAFKVRHPRSFGGYGDFDLRATAVRGTTRYAGEAAGFQDYLFGFGIRYALLSGFLSAQSLIEHVDYDALWTRCFGSHLRTSLLNRYWYEYFGVRGYDLLVRSSAAARNPARFWTNVYTRPRLRFVGYPMARRAIRRHRSRSGSPDGG